MTVQEATEQLAKLETFFEQTAELATGISDRMGQYSDSMLSEAECWYKRDAALYKNAAQNVRNALAALT